MDFLKAMSVAEIATFALALGSHGIEYLLKPKWNLFKKSVKKRFVDPIKSIIRFLYPDVFEGIILVYVEEAEEASLERNFVNRRQRIYRRQIQEMKHQLRLQLRENSRLCDELQRERKIEAKKYGNYKSFINLQVSLNFDFVQWMLFPLIILAIARCVKSLI